MRFPVDNTQTRDTGIKTTLLLLAIALSAIELVIPRIPLFPWLKPGMANIITMVWIIRFGLSESLLYALIRIWIVSFYFGFSFVTAVLGLSGAVCACIVMYLCWQYAGRYRIMGSVGIAVIGALAHNMGQLAAVYLLLAENTHIFYQIPIMIGASILCGALVGFVVPVILKILSSDQGLPECMGNTIPKTHSVSVREVSVSLSVFLFCMALVFVKDYFFLTASALGITIFALSVTRWSPGTVWYPIRRFWVLFVFIGLIHLFFSHGIRYGALPYITHEGVHNTLIQWLRLWVWIQSFFIFSYFGFNSVVMAALLHFFPQHQSTLSAGLLATEYFPAIIDMLRGRSLHLLLSFMRNPSKGIVKLFSEVMVIVVQKQEEEEN
jgi:heptaprenyl diphosphate synthase